MNRRQFFQHHQLAHSAGMVLGLLDELHVSETTPLPGQTALLRVARRAMATTFEIIFPFGQVWALEAASAALDEIDRLEDQLTVFRPESEVSRLNRQACTVAVPVESGLFDLLSLAKDISTETEGAFDISAGALIKTWGFYHRSQRVPSVPELREALECVGMSHVVLDSESNTVRFLRPGLEINLGSIGKGYALDRAAHRLRREYSVRSGLLHGGHSSVYAIGSAPGDKRGWAVAIRHPWDEEARLAVVRLRNRALGTSAATYQHVEHAGRKLAHILDPRTGWPAERLASASAVAPTAALADALATAFFIQGVDWARTYCEQHAGIGAILLPAEAAAAPVVIGLAKEEVD